MNLHYRFIWRQLGAHVHVDVRIGRGGPESTHALSGTLVFSEDEWAQFVEMVLVGDRFDRADFVRYGEDPTLVSSTDPPP